MHSFIHHHGAQITGVLSGFDRLVLRGNLRRLSYLAGMSNYLAAFSILLKDFGADALEMTRRLKLASLLEAYENKRPHIYLPSSHTSKEQTALQVLKDNPVEQGLIVVISCVEPCMSYDIYKNAQTKRLELVPRWRKGLHLYHYIIHSTFGFINARIQTWFPFNIQIYLNGRDWLSRELDKADIGYERRDNCFARVENVEKAHSRAPISRAFWAVTFAMMDRYRSPSKAKPPVHSSNAMKGFVSSTQ